MILTFIVFLVILTTLVLIHEAGHYFTAKYFGIKVEEFGFGFPPRAWGKKIGETIYSINWLPIGGFVKLYGEDEAGGGKLGSADVKKHVDRDRAFFAKPPGQRALVAVSGVVMNFILAAVLFYCMFLLNGFKIQIPLFQNYHFMLTQQANVEGVIITDIIQGSPASKAHIQTPSNILAIDGRHLQTINEFIAYINGHKGQNVHLSLLNMTTLKQYDVDVMPKVNSLPKQGALGVGISSLPSATALLSFDTPTQKIFSGISFAWNMSIYTVTTFGYFIASSFKEHSLSPIASNISGPVGVYNAFSIVTTQIQGFLNKIISLFFLSGLISISLAILNVLPIPALDGGRLFFILFELVFRKKVDPTVEGYIHTVGFAVLILLMVVVTANDIGKLLHIH